MDAAAHKEAMARSAIAKEALRSCKLCPRECQVDRLAGQSGFCQLTDQVHCFLDVLDFGEEKQLIPSHQVYFAGCNLSCEFCTVNEWNQQPTAVAAMDVAALGNSVAQRKSQGAKTLNLLGGEPSVSLHGVLELLSVVNADTQVVFNSNMYYNPLVTELLSGLVDIYLADFKCGSARCARELLGAEDYVEAVQKTLLDLRNGNAGDLIIRHLILPGHSECCFKPIIRWIADQMPGAKVSLRSDYVPPAMAGSAPKQYLNPEEFQAAIDFAGSLGQKRLNLIT